MSTAETGIREWTVSEVKPGPGGTVEVVASVAAAMAELPAIGKDSKAAKEQGGYAYRGIEAITGNLQVLLARHQVLTVPRGEILYTVPSPGMNEGWTDVTMRVEWLVVGADGSSFTAVTNGIGRDKSDKGANKAQTQAYKYLLLPLFCIADRRDDADGDSYEHGRQEQVDPSRARASDERLAEFHRVKDDMSDAQRVELKAWFAKEKVPAVDKATGAQVAAATTAAYLILSKPDKPLSDRTGPAPDATQVPAGVDIAAELDHEYSQLGEVQRAAFDAWCRKAGLPESRADASRADVLAAIGKARQLRSHTGPIDAEADEAEVKS